MSPFVLSFSLSLFPLPFCLLLLLLLSCFLSRSGLLAFPLSLFSLFLLLLVPKENRGGGGRDVLPLLLPSAFSLLLLPSYTEQKDRQTQRRGSFAIPPVSSVFSYGARLGSVSSFLGRWFLPGSSLLGCLFLLPSYSPFLSKLVACPPCGLALLLPLRVFWCPVVPPRVRMVHPSLTAGSRRRNIFPPSVLSAR